MSTGSKLWGGRFEEPTHKDVEEFTRSLDIDTRLWPFDVKASMAHVRMLGRQKILSAEDSGKIAEALKDLLDQYGKSGLPIQPSAEDIHSEIERLLTEKLGPVAGRLHTARSRNDQVVTAVRLCLREELSGLQAEIQAFQTWICKKAENELNTLLPGFTHLQHAQPISLAHHLLAYFWMLSRDRERISEIQKRVNQLPLGSAALAGTSFPIDRKQVADELGFEGICENSLDAVSDRDFALETISALSVIMLHLSRLSEELILWSTPEFGYVTLGDAVTTGSSIMPQKKNPDVAELIRGRTGRVTGALQAAMMMVKGLPLSYNRDLQEDKRFLFDAVDTTRSCVRLAHLMLSEARFHSDRMKASLMRDFSNATDLADDLAKKGVPFRQAHEITGQIVRDCIQRGIGIEDLTLTELKAKDARFDETSVACVKPEKVMQARTSRGGTSPTAVREQLKLAYARLACEH